MKKMIAAVLAAAAVSAFAQQPPESALNRQPIDGIDGKAPMVELQKQAKKETAQSNNAQPAKARTTDAVKQPRVDAAVMSADPNKASATL